VLGEGHELGELLKRLGTADAVVYLGGADHLHVLATTNRKHWNQSTILILMVHSAYLQEHALHLRVALFQGCWQFAQMLALIHTIMIQTR
jgi:hypothetical protein